MFNNLTEIAQNQDVNSWLMGDTDWYDLPMAVRDGLYDYFTVVDPTMPYDVQKARTDTPDEWMMYRLQDLLVDYDN